MASRFLALAPSCFVTYLARWHFFTAIGGYVAVAITDLITTEETHDDPTDRFAWPVPMAMGVWSASGRKEALKKS